MGLKIEYTDLVSTAINAVLPFDCTYLREVPLSAITTKAQQ